MHSISTEVSGACAQSRKGQSTRVVFQSQLLLASTPRPGSSVILTCHSGMSSQPTANLVVRGRPDCPIVPNCLHARGQFRRHDSNVDPAHSLWSYRLLKKILYYADNMLFKELKLFIDCVGGALLLFNVVRLLFSWPTSTTLLRQFTSIACMAPAYLAWLSRSSMINVQEHRLIRSVPAYCNQ